MDAPNWGAIDFTVRWSIWTTGTTWVWEVEITDDDERLCALIRMTIAVRPMAG